MPKWHVMTSSAKMPNNCWGSYRNVALVLVADGAEPPAIISRNAKQVLKLEHLGHHFDGKTDRCAYARTLVWAAQEADRRNKEITQ